MTISRLGWILILFVVPLASGTAAAAEIQEDLPEGLAGFSGQVTGVVVEKGEKDTFTFRVSEVVKVWKGNKAKHPKALEGRTVKVGARWVKGEGGKWHRVELQVQFIRKLMKGDDYRLELRHAEREWFEILELNDEQRDLAGKREERPEKKQELPADLRGFSGMVTGVVVEKNDDKGIFHFRVAKVVKVWKDSRAGKPEMLVGRTVQVGPRWEKGEGNKWHPVEIHVKFIRQIRKGDDYRLEIRNVEADHFSILELNEEQRDLARKGREKKEERPQKEAGLPGSLRGFSGQVAGIVVEKNDDKGVFYFRVAKVLKVWKDNKAGEPEDLVGRTVRVGPGWEKGDGGKWHRIEPHLRFIRKLVQGEDYRLELAHEEGDQFRILELSRKQRESIEKKRKEDY